MSYRRRRRARRTRSTAGPSPRPCGPSPSGPTRGRSPPCWRRSGPEAGRAWHGWPRPPISSDSGHSRRRVAALRCTSCTVVFEHPTEPAMLRWLIPRAVSLRISLYLIMSSPLSGDGATQCAPLGQSWSVMRAAVVGGSWNCGQWEMECRSLGPAVRTVTVNTRSLHLYEGSLRRTIPSLLHPQSTAPNLRLACSCEMQTYG